MNKDTPMMRPSTMLPPTHVPPPPQQPSAIVPIISTPAASTKATLVKTELQKRNLHQYEERDDTYQDVLNLQHKRHIELAQNKKRAIELASLERRNRMQPNGPIITFGPGYQGYGNGKTGTRTRIRFPHDKKKKREFKFPAEAIKEQATKEDVLVPIRIDLEHEGYKLRDTFTWNLNEQLITPEQFADVICEDLKLPQNIFMEQIAKAIKEQIDDYNLNASSMMKEDTEESVEQKSETLHTIAQESNDMPVTLVDSHGKGIELRTIIKLDITVGNRELVDQFEWDISCPRNSPEEFANILTTELGLGGEFKTAIAHSIREQIHVYIKSLLLVGYEFTNDSVIDDEIRHSFLPRLNHIVREHTSIEKFTPSITELSDAAVEKMEKDRMREARRGTRARRGIVLPDREPQKTHRTGFSVPPQQELTDEQLLNGNMYDQIGGSHKRSAALKARMNIAAEAADTGEDILGNSNMQSVISLGSMNKFQSMNDHQKEPDPVVRIRRQTTSTRIPPVIIVTGIKKEGRSPKIFDERPDTSIKIIVLDLRDNQDANNENQSSSMAKEMPLSIWENVLQIGRAYKPNQNTECAIQINTPTIDMPQIKRKPVQLQPTQYVSPQIEQRLLRKKTIPSPSVPKPPVPKPKKTVTFAKEDTVHQLDPENARRILEGENAHQPLKTLSSVKKTSITLLKPLQDKNRTNKILQKQVYVDKEVKVEEIEKTKYTQPDRIKQMVIDKHTKIGSKRSRANNDVEEGDQANAEKKQKYSNKILFKPNAPALNIEITKEAEILEVQQETRAKMAMLQTSESLKEHQLGDPMLVAEYSGEIFGYFFDAETRLMADPSYALNLQHEVNWNMRGVLIDWVIEIHHLFQLLPETLFLTVNIIDRFLSLRTVVLSKLQLVGITSLFIATKFEEISCPTIQDFLFMTDNAVKEDELIKAERFILQVLDFHLCYPNPVNFLRRVCTNESKSDIHTRILAKYFMEISCIDHRFIGIRPSKIAAASLWLSKKMLATGKWNSNLSRLAGYTPEELKPTVEAMLDFLAQPVAHDAFFKKWATVDLSKASIFVRDWINRYYINE
ncbi:hypothetical protein INT48_000075 [Thamnidium elegans]|uniref:Uncharacterized protein n=1 Tax=Thamnidium elegans TaxID=101142 RepID=A0A8H7VXW1_9FUNG|nr:hypothetical protein INT48_000075 [Thamnidium elegans]